MKMILVCFKREPKYLTLFQEIEKLLNSYQRRANFYPQEFWDAPSFSCIKSIKNTESIKIIKNVRIIKNTVSIKIIKNVKNIKNTERVKIIKNVKSI